jgi:hypothetical protein
MPSAVPPSLPHVTLLPIARGAAAEVSATLVVEARDLDTDERSRSTFAVPRPSNASEQRAQFAEAAAALHPSAKMRSFADGAATFLDRQHLIVAFYADTPGAAVPAKRANGASQERLFG